jgi:hypothetical protein
MWNILVNIFFQRDNLIITMRVKYIVRITSFNFLIFDNYHTVYETLLQS